MGASYVELSCVEPFSNRCIPRSAKSKAIGFIRDSTADEISGVTLGERMEAAAIADIDHDDYVPNETESDSSSETEVHVLPKRKAASTYSSRRPAAHLAPITNNEVSISFF